MRCSPDDLIPRLQERVKGRDLVEVVREERLGPDVTHSTIMRPGPIETTTLTGRHDESFGDRLASTMKARTLPCGIALREQ